MRLYPHMQSEETTPSASVGMEGNLAEALLFTYAHELQQASPTLASGPPFLVCSR